MPEYRVTYRADVIAPTPQQAAKDTWDGMRDPTEYPPILTVRDMDTGDEHEIDMQEVINDAG